MHAVDTNILIRLVTQDDFLQANLVANFFAEETIFISKTVLLETEWVLRYTYELDKNSILRALHGILGLPNVEIEDSFVVAQALTWFETGIDFADALHLASTPDASKFITFDKKLAKEAKQLKIPIVLLTTQ